jgi:hypothetical protein
VRTLLLDDGQLEVTVERRCENGLPHAFSIPQVAAAALMWINAAAMIEKRGMSRKRIRRAS